MFTTCCGADLLPVFVICPRMRVTTSRCGFVVLQGEMLAARPAPHKRGDSTEEALERKQFGVVDYSQAQSFQIESLVIEFSMINGVQVYRVFLIIDLEQQSEFPHDAGRFEAVEFSRETATDSMWSFPKPLSFLIESREKCLILCVFPEILEERYRRSELPSHSSS